LPITRWVKELDVTENKMTKFLEALGCTLWKLPFRIQKASVSEALELDTIRIARLTGPPRSKIKKFTRRR
uniref:Reverse transcriptase domain-containing protein n=1 Tax=Anisakis simplex TaxID=6269 RepID=A0A0M3JZ36_ANISI